MVERSLLLLLDAFVLLFRRQQFTHETSSLMKYHNVYGATARSAHNPDEVTSDDRTERTQCDE